MLNSHDMHCRSNGLSWFFILKSHETYCKSNGLIWFVMLNSHESVIRIVSPRVWGDFSCSNFMNRNVKSNGLNWSITLKPYEIFEERVAKIESLRQVEPKSGIVEANQQQTMTLKFRPVKWSKFQAHPCWNWDVKIDKDVETGLGIEQWNNSHACGNWTNQLTLVSSTCDLTQPSDAVPPGLRTNSRPRRRFCTESKGWKKQLMLRPQEVVYKTRLNRGSYEDKIHYNISGYTCMTCWFWYIFQYEWLWHLSAFRSPSR